MAGVIELARRHNEAFNSHDADGRAAIEAPDIELVMPGMTLRGHDEVMQVLRAFWEALPDVTISVEDQLAAGDVVVAEGTLAGTHNGTFRTPQGEIPPTEDSTTIGSPRNTCTSINSSSCSSSVP